MSGIRRAEIGEIDYHTIDRFTLAHGGVGAILGLIRAPWWLAVSSAIVWELTENSLKRSYPGLFYQPTYDTPQNAVVDIAAWILGWGLTYRLGDGYPLIAAKSKVS